MKVVVTGACGFIGSHVCEALLQRGDVVVGVDDFNDFYDPRLKEANRDLLQSQPQALTSFKVVRGNVIDDVTWMRTLGDFTPDVIVHLAAWAGVRPSIDRAAHYARQNVDGTVAVFDAARAIKPVPRIVFASSSSVYGGNAKVPFHEDDPVEQPVSPYAATKRAGELLAWTYHHLYGLDVACLRFFTVYGPRQRPEMAIHKFASLLAAGKPVPRYGDGKSRRDYTYIDDVVRAVLAAVDKGAGFGGAAGFRIYNIGNSRTVTLDELIEKLAAALELPVLVENLPAQPGDVPITFADITRAKEELGYRPDFPLELGLELFAKWFREKRAGP